ncbi:MAG: M14 family zinc carboxypeptidase [Flavobacteriales bacterium Tduv]
MKFDIHSLEKAYDEFKERSISSRIFRHADLSRLFKKHRELCSIDLIGHSIEKRGIFQLSWGVGSKKILIWSQMHGNETTGTAAMFDVLNFFQENSPLALFLLSRLNFSFIPMLNPDGAEKFQRRNALGVDPNRDGRALQSPEIRLLFDRVQQLRPEVLFNLHDQRSIFHVGQTSQPAVFSFLAPAEDEERTITENRKITMGIIACIEKELSQILSGKIGRYSDEFYPTSTGDCFQQLSYPCVLFEAGYYREDQQKKQSRKYNALALLSGFYALATEDDFVRHHHSYFSIPENGKNLLDQIYRQVKIRKGTVELMVDIALMIEEKYNIDTRELEFELRIIDIGDLGGFFGREETQANGKYYLGEDGETYPKLGGPAKFRLVDSE